jgi:hypothetical protein
MLNMNGDQTGSVGSVNQRSTDPEAIVTIAHETTDISCAVCIRIVMFSHAVTVQALIHVKNARTSTHI